MIFVGFCRVFVGFHSSFQRFLVVFLLEFFFGLALLVQGLLDPFVLTFSRLLKQIQVNDDGAL